MSEAPPDLNQYAGRPNIREQIARIDLAIAATGEFQAETQKRLRDACSVWSFVDERPGWQVIAALFAAGVAGGALLARALHLA